MKSKLRRNSFIIAVLVALIVTGLYWYGVFDTFENRSLDYRFRLRGIETPKSPTVIIEMDDSSMAKIGKPPWRRSVHARLVDILRKADVSAIVFDVLFFESDKDHPEDDVAFAKAMRKSNRTVSSFSFDYLEQTSIETDDKGKTVEVLISTVTKPDILPIIENASKALGYVNVFHDGDGNARRAHVLFWYEGQRYESLNVQAVAVAKNQSADELLEGIFTVDANPYNWGCPTKEVLINYRGARDNTFTKYSYAEVLEGGIPLEWLKGKIVLIGSTALGYFDHYNMAFQNQLPGIYFHANVIDNLWSKDFLVPAGLVVTVLLILIFGCSIGIVVPKFSAWWTALSVIVFAILFWCAGYFLMVKRLIYIELVAPTVSILGSYLFVFFYRFIVEQREKAGIKRAFGVYVNPHVVDQIAKNPDALKLGGEMREMTVMFSDVAGFTSISEKLSPQELVQLLNLYLTAMTDTIMKYDGTVDKYEGDAIMAFWGAPLLQPNHAKQSCLAVLENRQRLAELNVELEKKGMHELSVRCGVNSGPMNVGNMGSTQKFNYTVMGDAVNLASRLEGANKQYGTVLMISETTYEQAKDDVEVRELDLLRVKGKKLPIKVFELVCKKGELTDAQKKGFELFREGLVLYRSRHFKEALKNLQQVHEFLPDDGPAETYIKRAKDYIESPPEKDWDGVYVMTTK